MNTISKWLIACLALLSSLAVSPVQAQEVEEEELKLSPEAQALSKRLIENEYIWGEYINKEKGIHKIVWSSVDGNHSGIAPSFTEEGVLDTITGVKVYVSDAKKKFATALLYSGMSSALGDCPHRDISRGIFYLATDQWPHSYFEYFTVYIFDQDLFLSRIYDGRVSVEHYEGMRLSKTYTDTIALIYTHPIKLSDGGIYAQEVEYDLRNFPKILSEGPLKLSTYPCPVELPKEIRLASKQQLENAIQQAINIKIKEEEGTNTPSAIWEEYKEAVLSSQDSYSNKPNPNRKFKIGERTFDSIKLKWTKFPKRRNTRVTLHVEDPVEIPRPRYISDL